MASTVMAPAIHPRAHTTVGRATRTVVATFGVLAALAGIEHGVGEIAEGSGAPPGVVFRSWPDTAGFTVLDGEPAMTLVPACWPPGSWAIAAALALGVVRRLRQAPPRRSRADRLVDPAPRRRRWIRALRWSASSSASPPCLGETPHAGRRSAPARSRDAYGPGSSARALQGSWV